MLMGKGIRFSPTHNFTAYFPRYPNHTRNLRLFRNNSTRWATCQPIIRSGRAARTTAEVVTPRNRAAVAAGNPNSPTDARQNPLRASEIFRIRLPERRSVSVIPRSAAISRARVSKYLAGLDPPAHHVMQGPGGIQSRLSGHVSLDSVLNNSCQVYSETTSPIT